MDTLYQDQLLALAAYARTSSALTNPTHHAVVNNPLCGDKVSISIQLEQDIIQACHVEVKGCALCEAGAGLWKQDSVNKSLPQLADRHVLLASWLAGDDTADLLTPDQTALQPIRAIKNRHKCVLLAFLAGCKLIEME